MIKIITSENSLPLVTLTVGELVAALQEYDQEQPILFEWEGLRMGAIGLDITQVPENEGKFPPYISIDVDRWNKANNMRYELLHTEN